GAAAAQVKAGNREAGFSVCPARSGASVDIPENGASQSVRGPRFPCAINQSGRVFRWSGVASPRPTAATLVEVGAAQALGVEGCRAGQEFVEQHAQGIDVAPRVDI